MDNYTVLFFLVPPVIVFYLSFRARIRSSQILLMIMSGFFFIIFAAWALLLTDCTQQKFHLYNCNTASQALADVASVTHSISFFAYISVAPFLLLITGLLE